MLRCTNLNAYRNIYSRESIFLLKGNSVTSLITEIMIPKNLKDLERMEVLITSHEKVFLGYKYNSYIYIARNAKVTFTSNVFEKTVINGRRKVFRVVFRIHSNIYDEAFLRKKLTG